MPLTMLFPISYNRGRCKIPALAGVYNRPSSSNKAPCRKLFHQPPTFQSSCLPRSVLRPLPRLPIFLLTAPCHASFLDTCLLTGSPSRDIQDQSYIHRITNIILKTDWNEYDWDDIREFIRTSWKDTTFIACRELLAFSSMRRLTLD